MSDHSAIEWTEATWNPTTGCTKVSPGCANCYIERTAAFRIAGRKFIRGDIPLQLHENRLEQPLHWKKPRRVFVNSLSDLFHPDVPAEFIGRVFNIMGTAKQHTFQVLTKRPERMHAVVSAYYAALGGLQPESYPNVWLGVSVENQRFADERIPLLLQTPAAVRFLSCEPLLEGLDLAKHRPGANQLWVIVGGESGPGARPCDVRWVRSIVRQCQEADVPVFVKQLGPWLRTVGEQPAGPGFTPWISDIKLRDKKGGDPAEWPMDLRVREYPSGRVHQPC